MFNSQWNFPTVIHFGPGKVNQLAEFCYSLGIKRPLLITDPNLANFTIINTIREKNQKSNIYTGLFYDIQPNPSGRNVNDGIHAYQEGRHDGIIAIGGGSTIDVGKTVALAVNQKRPWIDFEDENNNYLRANQDTIPPIIAIPTTSGTGSEVGRAALIIDSESNSKKIIFHPKMMPSIVICDPNLTISVPPTLTATTGMDALAHNLESFCAPGFHPMADAIALEGIRLIKKWLPVAFKDSENLEARSYLMAASTMGATAFQKGLGAIHSLSHPVGAIYGKHHGLLNAIFTPYVLEYNRDFISDKMIRLSQYLHLESPSVDSIIMWTNQLNSDLKIPSDLKSIGVDDLQIDEIVRQAMLDGSTPTNPREMDIESVRQLLITAINGYQE